MKPATDVADIPETLLLGGAHRSSSPRPTCRTPGRPLNAATAPGAAGGLLRADQAADELPRRGHDDGRLLHGLAAAGRTGGCSLHTLLGTALTAAGSSVLNQYVERDYDALMPRTANRPLPAGRVSPAEGLAFGVLLSRAAGCSTCRCS